VAFAKRLTKLIVPEIRWVRFGSLLAILSRINVDFGYEPGMLGGLEYAVKSVEEGGLER
jgi:hypothetical protein